MHCGDVAPPSRPCRIGIDGLAGRPVGSRVLRGPVKAMGFWGLTAEPVPITWIDGSPSREITSVTLSSQGSGVLALRRARATAAS